MGQGNSESATLGDPKVPSRVGATFIEGDVQDRIERWVEQSAEIITQFKKCVSEE